MCGKSDPVLEKLPTLDEKIKWSKHLNELRKGTWKRCGLVAVGCVVISAWAGLFATGFLAKDRPEPLEGEVKALAAALNKTPAEATKPPELLWWMIDKETRSQARLASLAAFTAVVGFLLGRKTAPAGEEK
jgi:hypothetical protein